MQSGQNELTILWAAWVDRFSGRRVAAALSLVLIPLIGATGWITSGPAVGITAAAGVAACFVFLVAFAMAHEQVVEATGTDTPAAAPEAGGLVVEVASLPEPFEPPEHTTRFAH